jgi:3-methyladenine DNA glycosylase AlkD
MGDIIARIRADLEKERDEAVQASARRFFKEAVRLRGVKTPVVNRIARESFKLLRQRSKPEIFDLCEALWKSGYLEEAVIAANWSYALRKLYEPRDFEFFERWVHRYVSNWAACDTLCNHTVGAFLEKFPGHVPRLKTWARSGNLWVRRASAVSLIVPARRGLFLQEILDLADILLVDAEDLVRKGYGWMLKAAGEAHRQEVFAFVCARRETMPRTALRYAIEKMPPEMRAQAMTRGPA